LFAAALVALPAWPAHAASATTPTGDFVVGGGTTAKFVIPGVPVPVSYQNIVIDAHSDPSGANAGGTVSFEAAAFAGSTPSLVIAVGGPVTCLAVSGNDALIGFNDVASIFPAGPSVIHVIDNGSSGSSPDEFFSDPIPTDCGETPAGLDGGTIQSGDIVVHDAVVPTSRPQCLRGGWQQFVDDEGQPFSNQGRCIAFVATHPTP
jgi:hypothetical protein